MTHAKLALAAVSLAALFTAMDVGADMLPEGPLTLAADFIDKLLLVGVIFAAVWAAGRVRDLEAGARVLEREVSRAVSDGAEWRRQSRRLLDGLSEAIEAQFAEWGFTEAEADIAGLILKGAPLKDIAALRRTSETTIRQQAQGIYRKSGLANRTEFAAYFLEDLFTVAGTALGPKVTELKAVPTD